MNWSSGQHLVLNNDCFTVGTLAPMNFIMLEISITLELNHSASPITAMNFHAGLSQTKMELEATLRARDTATAHKFLNQLFGRLIV